MTGTSVFVRAMRGLDHTGSTNHLPAASVENSQTDHGLGMTWGEGQGGRSDGTGPKVYR